MIPAPIRRAAAATLDRVLARVAPAVHAASLTRRDYADHSERCARYSLPQPSPRAASILSALHQHGYYTEPHYWDRDRCQAAVADIDRVLREHPELIHPAGKSDRRFYGVDVLSTLIAQFGNDPALTEVASLHNRMPTRLGMTLGARLPFIEGNIGSGEGWHRDQFFVATKAMLYLTDVGPKNGPFQMLAASARLNDVCRDIKTAGLRHMQYRIEHEQIRALLSRDPARLLTLGAAAGTLLVFNASSIHRGKPIEQGVRYALTNYYFTAEWSDAEIHKLFAPMAVAPKARG